MMLSPAYATTDSRPWQIVLSIAWTGDGLAITGNMPDGTVCDPLALALGLFARHEDSYYGTLCKTVRTPSGWEGVWLSPLDALVYFADPEAYQNPVYTWFWTAPVHELRRAAQWMRETISGGRYVPDFTAWRSGQLRWKPDVADVAASPAGEAAGVVADAGAVHEAGGSARSAAAWAEICAALPFAGDWFDMAVRAWLDAHPERLAAWNEVCARNPWFTRRLESSRRSRRHGAGGTALAAAADAARTARDADATGVVNPGDAMHAASGDEAAGDAAAGNGGRRADAGAVVAAREPAGASDLIQDEEDFLLALGFRTDDAPFVTGLRLMEPRTEDAPWRLEVVLLDKAMAGQGEVAAVEGTGAHAPDAASALSAPAVLAPAVPRAAAPAAWRRWLHRADKAEARIAARFPWLAGEDGRVQNEIDDETAWRFLREAAPALAELQVPVLVPAWWDALQKARPKLVASIQPPASGAPARFSLEQTVAFSWRVALGGVEMTEEEFAALVAHERRLMQFRGRWLALDPALVAKVEQAMRRRAGGMTLRELIALHLTGDLAATAAPGDDAAEAELAAGATAAGATEETSATAEADATAEAGATVAGTTAEVAAHAVPDVAVAVDVSHHPRLAELLRPLADSRAMPLLPVPAGFHGTLRPYQQVGFSWLAFLRQFGLGACLADDMGLGKTVQFIAYLLHLRAEADAHTAADPVATGDLGAASAHAVGDGADHPAPALLVCPTSVIGNWQKELQRFAPGLRVYVHYGPGRAHGEAFAETARAHDLVLTSYTLCHLDRADLGEIDWACVCLDEAQNIKNPHAKQAQAVRRLRAEHRIALTGTPVENRLTELWSIFQFLNPGYLGSLSSFMRRFARPIERDGDREALARLQRLIQPFLLRRTKRDPSIALDLPDKTEHKAFVALSKEQAALYQTVVDEMMRRLDDLDPMERRGLILATLTKLKQVCDHPALFLGDPLPTGRALARFIHRSVKLARLLEMVEELREEGDACLIFTQFVEAGRMLQTVLTAHLGEEVLFLHGGVPKRARDEMVARFQAGAAGVFILSLRAGGIGLNLTAANHVFHFDRWWNPAVEDQATDRAYRIGQSRHVQVHKFVALGTLEERIDQMLEDKQALRQHIASAGEAWITELSTDELRELFALRQAWVAEE
ncbi:hypothetical protein GCM10010885_16980 [Alicyclobacillus cellulosilyticus]|uniref:SNF2 family DNA or RNA helicase n=1 Tax=Alicyclobacillus cellulosilyticus TaxID=1003997 RepID=A0A917NKY2_9BACL|nr:DEAD/DEAH box helicase [Alicyclobacillus cellulosilyticus]GGJ08453.1 hypothetical protein GCM10010885_16980 [Alicyclobacillus cellulosilyticus]